jgi:hypothetical protein
MRINEIFSEILDLFIILTVLSKVIIDPSDQNFFWLKFSKSGWLLTFFEKSIELSAILKVHFHSNNLSEKLPEGSKHKMWNLLNETCWADTDQFNTERFRSSETKFKIVVNLENTHVLLVFDDSEINSIGINSVNDFTEKDTVIESVEEGFTVGSDWEVVSKIWITLKDSIDQFSESGDLIWAKEMFTTVLVLSDSFESIWVCSLHFNHHIDELTPANDSISILIVFFNHGGGLLISGGSVSHFFHDRFELFLVHVSILVGIEVLEGLDEARDFLWSKVLSLFSGDIVGAGGFHL